MSDDIELLMRRIQALEDREAIFDLAKDYCNAIDDRDIEQYVSLLATDVKLSQFGGANPHVGRDAAREFMTWRFTQWGVTRHYPLNHRVTLTSPDEATGIVNGWAEMAMDGKFYVTAMRYFDRYIREDGHWRFAERVFAFYYYAPITDLPGIYATPFRTLYRGQDEHVEARRADLPEALPGYQTTTLHPVPDA